MDEYYPPIFVEGTADDILAVLRDIHRQQCTHDPEADPTISLFHESTIAEWREACDLLPCAKIAEAMNAYFRTAISMQEWREALAPAKERRLGGVCELVARHAKLPHIWPATLLGSRCAAAGAFLTIRSYLAEAGADVTDVAPSTPLDEYTRRYAGVFLGPVSVLAPGALPLVKIRTPVYHAFTYGMLIAWLAMMVSSYAGLHTLLFISGLLIAISYAGVWTLGRWVLPKSVQFEGLRTFRDLSKVVAAGARTGNGGVVEGHESFYGKN